MTKQTLLSALCATALTAFSVSAIAEVNVDWTSPDNGSIYVPGSSANLTGVAFGELPPVESVGLDIAIVIDASWSMDSTPYGESVSKIDAAKEAAVALVNALPENNASVAIVSFVSNAKTEFPLMPLAGNKSAIIAAIDSLSAPFSSGTNLGAGIAQGETAIVAGHTTGRAKMQILLSDGETYGYYNTYKDQALVAFENSGVITHTVGVTGHSPAELQKIAGQGNGTYTNVTSLDELEEAFIEIGVGDYEKLTGVNLVLADGSVLENVDLGQNGEFSVENVVIEEGANVFNAIAYGDKGSVAKTTLVLIGFKGDNEEGEQCSEEEWSMAYELGYDFGFEDGYEAGFEAATNQCQ